MVSRTKSGTSGAWLRAERDDPVTLAAGERIGDKYEIRKLLGVGATASVYAAEHLEIGRAVAIKIVHRDLGLHDDVLGRFRREARVCGIIRDRHVAEVYDVGHLPDGAAYMVMELLDGDSLDHAIEAHVLTIPTVVDLGLQMLAGLAATHRVGVVHRDIKPHNLMLKRESTGEVVVKLVDFGLAKPLSPAFDRALTRDGVVVGTPDYMAPEQLRGDEVDERTDVYGAAVVLYEALTRRPPFDGPTVNEIVASVLRDPVPPIRGLRPDCPEALERFVLQGLARKPGDRFANAAEMRVQLGHVASDCGIDRAAADWGLSEPHPSLAPPALEQLEHRASELWAEPDEARAHGDATTSPPRPAARRSVGVALGVGMVCIALVAGALAVWKFTPASGRGAEPASANVSRPRSGVPATRSEAAPAGVSDQADERVTAVTATVDDAASPAQRPARSSGRHRPPHREPASQPPPAERDVASTAPAPYPVASSSGPDLVREANAAYIRGFLPEARSLYRRAIGAAPSNAAAWRGLAMTAARMGQRSDALRAFRRYLELAPGAPDVARIRERIDALEHGAGVR